MQSIAKGSKKSRSIGPKFGHKAQPDRRDLGQA
jgi:hypothetical protein